MEGSSASALSAKPGTEHSFRNVSRGDAGDGVQTVCSPATSEKKRAPLTPQNSQPEEGLVEGPVPLPF